MNKSILVIDTPERCLDCPLGNSEESDGEEVWCNILECTTYQKEIYEDEEEEELYNSKKPDWCPLKEVPNETSEQIERCIGIVTECLRDFVDVYNTRIAPVLTKIKEDKEAALEFCDSNAHYDACCKAIEFVESGEVSVANGKEG